MDHNAYWQQQSHGHYQHYPNTQQYDHQNVSYSNHYNPQQHYTNQAGSQNNVYSQNNQDLTPGNDWENNWGWGDEENSNFQNVSQQNSSTVQNHAVVQNNASASNNIESNFVNDESWNWSVEDNLRTSVQYLDQSTNRENEPSSINRNERSVTDNNSSLSNLQADKVETNHWSLDNAVQPDNIDQNCKLPDSSASASNVSSNFERPTNINKDLGHPPLKQEVQESNEGANFVTQDALENEEILTSVKEQFHTNVKPSISSHLSTSSSNRYTNSLSTSTSSSFVPVSQAVMDDTKHSFKQSLNSDAKSAQNRYQTSSSANTQDFSKPSSSSYPLYSQPVNLETLPDNSERPDQVPPRVAIKKAIPSRSSQQWQENNEVPINDRNQYLETGRLSAIDVPEASSDPNDTLPPPGLRRMVLGQIEQPENKVANSRNDEPPPGLSRMVLGQRESNIDDANQSSDDLQQTFNPIEPPEGLHRMVPGESSSPESTSRQQQYQVDKRQEDDSDYRYNQIMSQPGEPRSATLGADTPPIVPPTVNTVSRSETIIGANISSLSNTNPKGSHDNLRSRSQNMSNENRIGAVGLDSSSSSARNKDPSVKKHEKNLMDENFRDPIDGEPQDTIASIVTSIRNLTVGENVNDDLGSSDRDREPKTKHSSRQESSDSDPDMRSHRDERYRKRGDPKRERRDDRDDRYDNDLPRDERHDPDRYSPEYRDKKYSSRRRYKDRRYDEDTDYYSDREKERRGREDRNHDRSYGSLQRDKDRRRRDPRDYRDPRDREYDYRRNYYYSRFENESLNESQSRASSRSDSVHNAFRDRGYDHRTRDHRHHEKERNRRYRDPATSYQQGYGYDPYSQYYQQYQYYEALRRNNPQAYAELYRKYYQQNAAHVSYDNEDRASVHSGRSSANEGAVKERFAHSYDYTESSVNLDDANMTSHRLTPVKYATAHIKASINSGRLVRVSPNYPLDGQPALVEICNIESVFLNDDESKELSSFPGPLVRGTTHKKTIIEYCENKIKVAVFSNIVDTDSYILLWELLILLIRQNGMVVGADIAELLLKNRNCESFQRPLSVSSSISSSALDVNTISEGANQHISDAIGGSTISVLKETEITNKFREYLLYGSVKEALEWAMKNSLWGHALFLASKLDKRTYANVITRFANGLALNDPLQTLYQLLSGRTPASVTCIADEKWGDWRPHLAMILSNTTQYPEVNCRAVTTLGDTLWNRGCIYAAHFCYLMAEVGFGSYNDKSSKLVLLGGDHTKPFEQFATNEAIHMTEIYEYACSLNNPDFSMPNFQVYKYIVSTRLADCCMLEKALAYLERIAGYIVQNSSSVETSLVNSVYNLADKLKYYDLCDETEETNLDDTVVTNRPDNTWLKDLGSILYSGTANVNTISQTTINAAEENTQYAVYSGQQYDSLTQQQWQPDVQYTDYQQQNIDQQYISEQTTVESHLAHQLDGQVDDQNQYLEQPTSFNSDYSSQPQQPLWQPPNQWEQQNQYQDHLVNQQTSYYGSNTAPIDEPTPKPQISMPNQSKKGTYDDDSTDERDSPPSGGKPKSEAVQQQKAASSTGWFGGIFSRLAPKPKNQMKLPDDTNPTIVWDPVKKRWINNDDDGVSGSTDLRPPPKMSDLPVPKTNAQIPHNIPVNTSLPNVPKPVPMRKISNDNQNTNEAESKPTGDPNMFRMHGRSRNLKKSYVDVFNPGKKSSGSSALPHAEPLGMNSNIQQPSFFIPQPNNDPNAPADFLTPSLPFSDSLQGDKSQLQ